MTENFSDLFLDRRSLLFNYSRARAPREEILEICESGAIRRVCWHLERYLEAQPLLEPIIFRPY